MDCFLSVNKTFNKINSSNTTIDNNNNNNNFDNKLNNKNMDFCRNNESNNDGYVSISFVFSFSNCPLLSITLS